MGIPALRAAGDTGWSELDPGQKRERLLRAAGEVFARSGLQAPMPEVAAAAGAGVGSVYRQFPSKRLLLAALVIERLEEMREDAEAAAVSPAGPWAALVALLRDYAERQAGDDVYAEATACVSTEPEVARAHAATTAAWERLLAAARAEGRLRPDASTDDIRLVFAAMRAASQFEEGAWRRMLELSIDALAAA
jgi:AcrR family transcriptional regulator